MFRLKSDIDKMKDKKKLEKQIEICAKKIAWMEFEESYVKYQEVENDLKSVKQNCKKHEDLLKPMMEQYKHIDTNKKHHENNIKKTADTVQRFSDELVKLEHQINKEDSKITQAKGDFQVYIIIHNNYNYNMILQIYFNKYVTCRMLKNQYLSKKKKRHMHLMFKKF